MSKVLVLEDFLSEEHAEALADVINRAEFFDYVYKTGEEELPTVFTSAHKYVADRNNEEAKLKQSLVDGHFTYRQKRLIEHPNNCSCEYCAFVEDTLEREDFAEYIQTLGDIDDRLSLLKHFASIYDSGDFLSQHPDPGYDVAFILNLTKDWKYEYGGCLTVLEDDKPRVVLPKFNSLVLLFLGDEGIEHYVSEVSRLAPHPRIAISGWFNRNSS